MALRRAIVPRLQLAEPGASAPEGASNPVQFFATIWPRRECASPCSKQCPASRHARSVTLSGNEWFFARAAAFAAVCVIAAGASLQAGESKIETLFVARATAEHPRHSEAAVIELAGGDLFIAWQEYRAGGTGDSDFAPNSLVCMRSRDGGWTWGERRTLVATPEGFTNSYSPSLVRLPTGEIVLTFMHYHSFDRAGKRLYPPTAAHCWVSRDECATFEPRGTLWGEEPIQFASSTLKRLGSGRLLLPVSRDAGDKSRVDHYEAGTCASDDGGATWQLSEAWCDVPKRGAMEPHVEELRDEWLLIVMRTQMGSIYRSFSTDGGKNWSAGESLGIRAPESCPALARIPSTGHLLLVWNDNFDPNHYSHGGKRTPLVAAISIDEGATWSKPRPIETDPACAFTNPGIAFTSTGKMIFNYWTSQYRPNGAMGDDRIHLKLAIADVAWLYDDD